MGRKSCKVHTQIKMMKVLIVSPIIFPEIAAKYKLAAPSSGGWIIGYVQSLALHSDLDITVCFDSSIRINESNGTVNYVSFKDIDLVKLLKELNPDVIHIFGTESDVGMRVLNAAIESSMEQRVLVNIQGLTSFIAKYYYSLQCAMPISCMLF